MTRRTRHRSRGAVGGFEVLPFGFLMFVSVMLVIANAWAVIDSKFAVDAAAREAARGYVEAPTQGEADAVASRRARETMDAYGRGRGDRFRLDSVELEAGAFTRCARVTIEVSYEVPALTVPFIGGFGRGITARSAHSEVVDPYRSGPLVGGCA